MSSKSLKRQIKQINCYIVDQSVSVKQRKLWYEQEIFNHEVWREVEGSERSFLVSNYGRFKRIYSNSDRLLLPFLKKRGGYLCIKVKFLGTYKAYKISSLVAYHFIRKPRKNERILHKNGIKTDNFAGNLEYCSMQKIGMKTGFKSRSKPVVQLDRESQELINEFRSAREAGRKCFLSYQAVLDNCNHKSRTSGGYVFMFSDEYEQKVDADG